MCSLVNRKLSTLVWYQSCTKWSRLTPLALSIILCVCAQGHSVVEGSTSGQLWLSLIGGDFLPIISHITTVSPCPVVTVLVRESAWGGVCQRYCMLGSRFLSLIIYNLYLPVANFSQRPKKVANVNFFPSHPSLPDLPPAARTTLACFAQGVDQLSMIKISLHRMSFSK